MRISSHHRFGILAATALLSLPGCKLTSGQDPGLMSADAIILSSLVVQADCPRNATMGEEYKCAPQASVSKKIDAAQLIWELTQENTCSWVSVNPSTGEVFGSPNPGEAGSCMLAFRVMTTDEPSSDYKIPLQVNVPVTVTSPCPTRVEAGTAISCQPVAAAPVASPRFTWSLDAANTCAWLAVNPSTGLVSGTPPVTAAGRCLLAVSANVANGVAGTATTSITVDMRSYREAPVVDADLSSDGQGGAATAIDGAWAAVGSPFATNGDGSTGFVSVFRFDGANWVKTAILRPRERTQKEFGRSLAISGGTLIVGAPESTDAALRQGSVSFYELSGTVWNHKQTVWSPTKRNLIHFGASVALEGGRAVVGTSRFNIDAAFVLERSTAPTAWTVVKGLDFAAVSSNKGAERIRVALTGSYVIVADRLAGAGQAGQAHVFRLNGGTDWVADGVLVGAAGDAFGSAVAAANGRILIGAPTAVSAAGRAYLFERGATAWTVTNTFTAPDAAANRHCGSAVALTASRALMGCENAPDGGSAYLYGLSGSVWSIVSKLFPAQGRDGDRFGHSVGVSGTTLLIGSPAKDTGGMRDSGGSSFFMAR